MLQPLDLESLNPLTLKAGTLPMAESLLWLFTAFYSSSALAFCPLLPSLHFYCPLFASLELLNIPLITTAIVAAAAFAAAAASTIFSSCSQLSQLC
jgi:hypothetical protein